MCHGLNAHQEVCLPSYHPSTAIGNRVATHGPVITIWVGSELHGDGQGKGKGRKEGKSQKVSRVGVIRNPTQCNGERFQAIGPLGVGNWVETFPSLPPPLSTGKRYFWAPGPCYLGGTSNMLRLCTMQPGASSVGKYGRVAAATVGPGRGKRSE
jgi:hypothetical protein